MQNAVPLPALDAAHQLDGHAKAQMQRGIGLLAENSPENLRLAVQCFDEAIALRRQLPSSQNAWFRYGYIAAWLNRGDALTRLGSANELREALRSYDEALAQLRELPMAESPLFVRRLAIAWLNRGVTLVAQGTPESMAQAVENFAEAVAAAKNFFAKEPTEGRLLVANTWTNHANALVRLPVPQASLALASARNALELLRTTEHEEISAAETGLCARHILCQAIAHLVAHPQTDGAKCNALLAEATNVVEEGMSLVQSWVARKVHQFEGAAGDLFEFGCRVYQLHQPHFLTEFLLENLEHESFRNNLRAHTHAAEALWRAVAELHREGFRSTNTPRFEETLQRLRELRVTEERLAELRLRTP